MHACSLHLSESGQGPKTQTSHKHAATQKAVSIVVLEPKGQLLQCPNKETPELSGVANARAPNNDIGPMPTGNVSKAAVCMGLCVSSHQLS